MGEFGCWEALGLCVRVLVFLFACVRLMYLVTCVYFLFAYTGLLFGCLCTFVYLYVCSSEIVCTHTHPPVSTWPLQCPNKAYIGRVGWGGG